MLKWRKACDSAHCVEVAFDEVPWLTACDSNACVEVQVQKTQVKIRDSKDPGGPVLTFTMEEWTQFTDGVARGAFDR